MLKWVMTIYGFQWFTIGKGTTLFSSSVAILITRSDIGMQSAIIVKHLKIYTIREKQS